MCGVCVVCECVCALTLPLCRSTSPDPAPEEVRVVTVKPTTTKPYVPIGHDPKNKNGRICSCGSDTHIMVTHNMCPLNTTYWPGLSADRERLKLYVGRNMWRWWEFGPNDNRRCAGCITAVTDDLQLQIKYEDEGLEELDESTFLKIVRIMKKDNKPNRKRKR